MQQEIKCDEKHLVGYVDILGTKDVIKKKSSDAALNSIYRCYLTALDWVKILNPTTDIPFKVKIFSDNIIVALSSDYYIEGENHPAIAFNRMTTLLSALQRLLLDNDILCRGAITFDNLFIDDVMVWGPALVEAYELESKIAVYPRIILSETLKDWNNLLNTKVGDLFDMNNIKEDYDGQLFINYLNYPQDTLTQSIVNKSMEQTNKILANETRENVKSKYRWHKKYLESLNNKNAKTFE